MFFDKKNKKIANERTIYQNRPNMILGCKKAIYGIIVLIILFWISGPVKSLISDLQMYMISYIKIGLTGYVMLAIVLLMLFDLIYIIWQLLSWYSTSYTITNQRIIAKKGVLNTKKTYMPYRSIQDIDLSQNILEKILNIGTIRAYSAYDNNSMVLSNISNPGEVEDILFNQINKPQQDEMYADREYKPRGNNRKRSGLENNDANKRFYGEEYYPEDYRPELNNRFVEEESPQQGYRSYEYEDYPEYGNRKRPQNYDYEYYDDNLEDNISYAMNDIDRKYNSRNDYQEDPEPYYKDQDLYYKESEPYYKDSEPYYNDYDYDSMEEFYQNNKEELNIHQEEKKPQKESSEKIVERHFQKFDRWNIMELLFIQSQEHPELPFAELKAVMECEEIQGKPNIITEGLVTITNISKENLEEYYRIFTKRLGYTHEVHEVIEKFPASQLEEKVLSINWKEYISENFAVRVKRFNSDLDTTATERKVGSLILSTLTEEDNIKVKLDNPKSLIKIVAFEDTIYLACEKIKLDKKHFEEIKPHKRPFFYPGSMSPKLARCMVNLSRVKENQLLLDPFCGTGGILIEGGLIGCKVAGSDINWKMKNGTAINLEYCGIENYRTFNVDVRELKMYEEASAVVTDPPYGISTSTGDMKGNDIFKEFFTSIFNNMKDDAYLCMASPHYVDLEPIAKATGFKILEQYYIKMHRSLTRVITVLRKDNEKV